MTMTYFIRSLLCTTLACSALSAATVSIVNQQPLGATVPSGTAIPSSTVPQNTNQYNQTTPRGGTGPALGKLPQNRSPAASKPRKPKIETSELALHAEEPTYTFPGLVARIGRRWVGNDYLYNLHRNIGIVVEVVQPDDSGISVDKETLKSVVSEIFNGAELVPESLASENGPPLPFFHVLIFATKSDASHIAFVSGRLFEDALLSRYGLDPIGTWQAISWEKQDLVVASPLQFDEQIKKSVAAIAQTFVDRVEMYAKIKEESESNAKLYYPSAIVNPPKPSPGLRSNTR